MSESFFITGGSLRADAPSYVERAADEELFGALRAGEFCYVLTSRQMGKSSLMVRSATRLREAGERVAVLDLTAIGQNVTPEQWYDGLLMRLGEQLGRGDELEEFWRENARLGPLQRFMGAIRQLLEATPAPRRLVIFIDEIDTVRSLPFSTDEFFAAIRACYNRRAEEPPYQRLTFCLMGVATPSDLIRDTRLTPFNIGRRIELEDFTEAEALPLARGLVPEQPAVSGQQSLSNTRRPTPDAQRLLQRVLHWSGGHPYLTQRLCQAVSGSIKYEGGRGKGSAAFPSSFILHPWEVDRHCEELFLSAQARERDDNLISVRERLLRGAPDLAGLLELYGRVRAGRRVKPDDTNVLLDALRLSGAVKLVGDRLAVRNRIYARVFEREWLRSHLPGAEARRQRDAYRRGVVRTAWVSAALIAAMAGLTAWAQVQSVRAESGRREARVALSGETLARAAEGHQRRVALEQRSLAEMRETKALRAERLAEAESRRARAEQANATRETRRAERAERVAIASASRAGRSHYVASMALVQHERERGTGLQTGALLAETRESPNRGFEWGFWRQRVPRHVRTFGEPVMDAPPRKRDDEESDDPPTPHRLSAISSDGRWSLGIADGGVASLVTPDGVRRRLPLRGPLGPVRTVVLSAHGTRALTLGVDGAVRLWNLGTGSGILHLPPDPEITTIALSPDGERILIADGKEVRTYDSRGRRIGEQKGLVALALAFSSDGGRAIAGAASGARIWDVAAGTGAQTLGASGGAGSVVGFDPEEERAVVAAGDHRITLWDLATGQVLHTLRRHTGAIHSARFSPDGALLVTASNDRTIRIWDTESGQQIHVLPGLGDPDWSASFLPDGRRIVSSSARTVRVWELERPNATRKLSGGSVFAAPIAFSRNGRRLLTMDGEGLRIWDARTTRQIARFSPGESSFTVPALSPDGSRVAVGAENGDVTIWRVDHARPLAPLRGHTGEVYWCAFSPTGALLATGSKDRTARIWNPHSGRTLLRLTHSDEVLGVVFSADGRRLLSGSADGTARLWETATGRCLKVLRLPDRRLGAVSAVAFSPDGRTALSGYQNGSIALWELPRARLLKILPGTDGIVLPAAFSPDGRRVLSGRINASLELDVEETLKGTFASTVLWDTGSGRPVLTLRDGPGALFSPDGSVMAVGSLDGNVYLHSGSWQNPHPRRSRPQPPTPHP